MITFNEQTRQLEYTRLFSLLCQNEKEIGCTVHKDKLC